MKKLKWIFCICAILCALLLTATQAGAVTRSGCGDKGDNVLWTLDDEGTLTLTGEGAVKDSSSCPWAYFKVKRVVVNEGVTRIGKRAFYNMKDVKEVQLPESLTTIGKEAFYGCTGLREVTIPSGVTEIEEYAFVNCTNLFKINTDDLAAWCAIRFKSAFANPLFPSRHLYVNNEKILDLEIPQGVTEIGDFAFYTSPEFRSVKLPEGLESIGQFAFYDCAGVTAITLPDSLKSVGQEAFTKCGRLQEITVGSIIGEKTLKELSIPAETLKMVTVSKGTTAIAPYACKEYRKLESVELPASLQRIGKDAFYSCTGLKNVVITDLGAWCGIEFACPYSNPLFFAPNLWIREGQLLTKVTDPEIPEGVTAVSDYAFYKYQGLKSFKLPETVRSVGKYAFYECKALKEAVFSTDLAAIGQDAFEGCASLCDITIGKLIAANTLKDLYIPAAGIKMVTVLDGTPAIAPNAFKNCGKLESVVLPASVQNFGKDAFYACNHLRNVVIDDLEAWCRADFACPYANPLFFAGHLYLKEEDDTLTELLVLQIPEGITEIKPFAFYGFKAMRAVEIPEGVTQIGYQAFYNCAGLNAALLPKTLQTIGQEAFRYCSRLTSLTLPGSMTQIAQDAFKNCTALAELKIGDLIETKTLKQLWLPTDALKKITVTEGVTAITAEAFRNCAKLEEIVLPESLTFIGKDAFFGCISLRKADVASIRSWLNTELVCPYSNPLIYSHRLFVRGQEVFALTVPQGVTEIKDYAFYSANYINALNIPSSVKRIGTQAFCGCVSLTKAGLPEGTEIIGDYAFRNCANLTDLILPTTLTYVGQGAFDGCKKLVNIWYAGTEEQWPAIGGPGRDITLNEKAKVYYDSLAVSEDISIVNIGDADGDGIITPADARLALRAAVQLEPCEKDSALFIGCDWNCDGKVTPEDARMILRFAVKLA